MHSPRWVGRVTVESAASCNADGIELVKPFHVVQGNDAGHAQDESLNDYCQRHQSKRQQKEAMGHCEDTVGRRSRPPQFMLPSVPAGAFGRLPT